jgi:hypothetical protein
MPGAVYVGGKAPAVPSLDILLGECLAAFGADLTAYLAGAGDGRPLAGWRLADAVSSPRARGRMETAYHVLKQFKEPQHARAWLRNVNVDLGRRSPADLIRTARDRSVLARVRVAAELAPQY